MSESNVVAVTKYIASQEEHHKKHSFQEELLAFLKKNDVTYDEKYLWGQFLSPLRGLSGVTKATHGWRRGLHSCAALRLASPRFHATARTLFDSGQIPVTSVT